MSRSGERFRDVLTYLALPALLLLAWHLSVVGGLVREQQVPAPGQVAAALADLVFASSGAAGHYGGDLPRHALVSLGRVYLGFALAVLVAVPLGVGIGLKRGLERFADPTIQLFRNIPITGFLPIVFAFLGFSELPAIFVIALAAFFPAVVNTTYGVRQIPPSLVRSARMMGARRIQRMVRVIVPAASPAIFTGLRLSMGVAWVIVVVAEFIGPRSGLGYLLWDAYQFFARDVMIAAMVAIGVLGFLSDRLIVLARHRLLAWNRLGTLRG